MWQEIFNHGKTYSFITFCFFTFCAGLYHLAFWQTFGIDGISLVGLGDFIKSFIHPVCSGLLFTVVMYLFFVLIPKAYPFMSVKIDSDGLFISIIGLLFTISNMFFLLYFSYYNDYRVWVVYPFIFSPLLSKALTNSKNIETHIPNLPIRQIVIAIVAYLPIYSYCMGNYSSNKIFSNKEYDYIVSTINNDTLKHLGNTARFAIFTNTKNNKKLYINIDKVDTFILFHKK